VKDSKLLRPALLLLILAVAGIIGAYVILPIWTEKSNIDNLIMEAETRNQVQITKLRKLEQDSGNLAELTRQLETLELSIPAKDEFEDFIVQVIEAIGDSGRLESFSTTASDGSTTGVNLDTNASQSGFSLTIRIKDTESSKAMLDRLQNISRAFLAEKVSVTTTPGTNETRLVVEGVIFFVSN